MCWGSLILYLGMKIFLTITSFILINLSIGLNAQNKRDYQWIIGGNSAGGGILLDFNYFPVGISYKQTGLWMDGSNTTMSDESGNLLFASNGCKVINSQGQIMENGDSINPGLIEDIYCYSGGSPLIQGVIAIPSSEGDSIFYVFNVDFDQPYGQDTSFLGVAPQRLFFQKIDMAQDSVWRGGVKKSNSRVRYSCKREYSGCETRQWTRLVDYCAEVAL